jgi:hypothetical protein
MKYFLIVLALFSCNNIHHNDSRKVSAETLDTIKTPGASIVSKPIIFESAFITGTTETVKNLTVNFYGITIGKIKITSGHIIACDPLHIDEYGIPFTQVFPKGEFPVQLSILALDNQERIAFARINFSDEPVVKWVFALQPGQTQIPLGEEKIHGYSVDGGVGIFIDEEAVKALDQKAIANFEGGVFKDMYNHYHIGWRYSMYNFGKYNLAAFTTGSGDGYFATYIGFDAKGQPCRLVTDFNVFDWGRK